MVKPDFEKLKMMLRIRNQRPCDEKINHFDHFCLFGNVLFKRDCAGVKIKNGAYGEAYQKWIYCEVEHMKTNVE